MPHSSNKELIFGIMVGTAGISLLLLCYCKVRKSRTTMNLPKFLSLSNTIDSITLQDEMHNGQGTIAVSQRRQLQILEKLNELLTNMEELKEEIRFLKETIPKLEEYIQGELGGKVAAHKISPQHRTRKRKVTTVQSSATSNSSEEAESEGGCCNEDQGTADSLKYGMSSSSQSFVSADFKTPRPSAAYKVNLPRGSAPLSSLSNTSTCSFLSAKRHSISSRFKKRYTFPSRQQSRANFESEEDENYLDFKPSAEPFAAFPSRRRFSSRKLSVVSCYKSAIFWDPRASGQDMFNLSEIEIFSENPSNTDTERRIAFSLPEFNGKNFKDFETRTTSDNRNAIGGVTYQQSAASLNFPPTVVSSPGDIQEDNQFSKYPKDSLYPGSQNHVMNYSPAMIE